MQSVLDINKTIKIMFRSKIKTIPIRTNFCRDYRSSDSFSQLSSLHIFLLLFNISGMGITVSKNKIWKVQQNTIIIANYCWSMVNYLILYIFILHVMLTKINQINQKMVTLEKEIVIYFFRKYMNLAITCKVFKPQIWTWQLDRY